MVVPLYDRTLDSIRHIVDESINYICVDNHWNLLNMSPGVAFMFCLGRLAPVAGHQPTYRP